MSYHPFRAYFDLNSIFKENALSKQLDNLLDGRNNLDPLNDTLMDNSFREHFTYAAPQMTSLCHDRDLNPSFNNHTSYIPSQSSDACLSTIFPYCADIAPPKKSRLPSTTNTDVVIDAGLLNPNQRLQYDEKFCALCKRNGEAREFYTTHVLKDNRGKVVCPILRKYVCPKCGATGDNSHTIKHCPTTKDRSHNNQLS